MFAWLRYKQQIWTLTKERRRANKRNRAAYVQAQKDGKSKDELSKLFDIHFHESTEAEELITDALTNYLYELAYHYRIPTPDFSDNSLWEDRGDWTSIGPRHSRRLTEKAFANFQAAIRQEQKERLQVWELRTKVVGGAIAGLTGLVGALIGLVAILR